MKSILSGQEMARFDKYTIEEIGIPSLVLMERAALSCVDIIKQRFSVESIIYVVCGPGNNGADGVAIARILHTMGYNISYSVVGDMAKYSKELCHQINIADNIGVKKDLPLDSSSLENCDLIVDALFGIGLSRNPVGDFANAINIINSGDATVLAVDIPSGICANTGKSYDPHVDADFTVSFQHPKKGLLLSDGYLSSGKLFVTDIGIQKPSDFTEKCFILDSSDISSLIPDLPINANKGSRGKVLIIAGSESIYGACYLSVKAALKTGCGYAKVLTHKNNIASIQKSIPEAMYTAYEKYDESLLAPLVDWADAILIGPGLSTNDVSKSILSFVLNNAACPVVIDADGINILSENLDILHSSKCNTDIVLTPHLKEMSRLCGESVNDIQNNMEETANNFCQEYHCSIILKSFTSYIYTKNCSYINTAGNQSMATAGSGDVLAGITTSLISQGLSIENALPVAAYIHGCAGESASENLGINHVLASDIIDYIE